MDALPATLGDDGFDGRVGRPIALRRNTVLTALTFAGIVCTLALWWFESATGLISQLDRYGYPYLLAVFAAGLFAQTLQTHRRIQIEMACYFGVALYFIAALVSFVILQNSSNIYIVANTLQWMPLVYIAAFVFFSHRRALIAGIGVFAVSLVPSLVMTVSAGFGFWSMTVAALLINAYAVHLLTLLALSLVLLLHEQLRQARQALLERDEALVSLKREADERLRLEEQLRQSQRMEAVGQLTGGIAHDFNNLLTVVIGSADALVESPSDPVTTARLAQTILEAAERGADLTQKLLAYGRRQSLRPERVALQEVVDATMPLLRRTLGEHIDVRVEAKSGAAYALADRTLLESAILNLALNARDAMNQGGILTIATGERLSGPDEGTLPIGQPVVFVTVSDTGVGMSPEVMARVFEPFFTTKDIGKGSGLGLSMVHGFAEQSGGHVAIESAPGRGTAVTIVLRAVSPEPARESRLAGSCDAIPHRKRVLLVEEEPQILQTLSAQLIGLGYDITAVSSGHDALDKLVKGDAFDLLLTDAALSNGVGGTELMRRARALRPDLKVVLTFGRSGEAFKGKAGAEAGAIVLRKPYGGQDLAEALRRATDEGA